MYQSSKELKNIPVSISILHEQEYNNIYLTMKVSKGKAKRRHAISERSSDKSCNSLNHIIVSKIVVHRRKTLKN